MSEIKTNTPMNLPLPGSWIFWGAIVLLVGYIFHRWHSHKPITADHLNTEYRWKADRLEIVRKIERLLAGHLTGKFDPLYTRVNATCPTEKLVTAYQALDFYLMAKAPEGPTMLTQKEGFTYKIQLSGELSGKGRLIVKFPTDTTIQVLLKEFDEEDTYIPLIHFKEPS